MFFGLPDAKRALNSGTIYLFNPAFQKDGVSLAIKQAIDAQNLSEVENIIEAAIKASDSPEIISCIIATLSSKEIREAFFNLILGNTQIQDGIIKKSYLHDNGFEKWVLIDNPNFKLRLHVYEDTSLIPQENRHNHSWDFASCILEGCLQNTIYDLDSSAYGTEELLHYRYSPVRNGAYGTELMGKKYLKKMTDLNMSQGTAYFMPAEVIHRISYEQTFKQRTITLMITGNRKDFNCDLFSTQEFKEEKVIPKIFNKMQLTDRFREVATL